MYSIKNRIAIAREIFTADEITELCKYEFFNLWEVAKSKLEYFVYAAVVLIWIGVFSIIYTICRMTITSPTIDEKTHVEVEETKDPKSDVEKIIKENQSPYSSYTSDFIYVKVLNYSVEFNLNPSFILALIEKECNFYDKAKAKDFETTGSIGWSQATKPTWDLFNSQYVWPKYNTVWDHNMQSLSDPDKSLTFICWYLNWLKTNYPEKTKSDYDLYCAYNAGPYYKQNNKDMHKNAEKFVEKFNRYFIAFGN